MFYDKEITIFSVEDGEVDDLGIYIPGDIDEYESKTIECDVQAYSKERLYQDYGFSDDVTFRVFCDPDSDLKTGVLIEYDSEIYKIKRIIKWDDYWILAIGSDDD